MASSMTEEDEKYLEFHEMGLDDRILKAIAKLGWIKPTPIQEKSISLALEGKDLLVRARTGSGKTAAVAIPIIQKILEGKQTAQEQCVKALILVPSKELCKQAHKNFVELTRSCSREIKCVDISGQVDLNAQKPLLLENPDIVVGTPSRVLAHLQASNLYLKEFLEMLVIDEADLIFSFGYEADVKAILGYLPKIYQAFLMSATLSEDVKALKKLVLHNAYILKLQDLQLPETNQLTQYQIKCEETEKFVLICALFKLFLIRGKSIIFVNTVDRGYRLKLFFEQFGIPACILNSELPINSRNHIMSQFNEGLYSCLIASDELALEIPDDNTADFKKKKQKSRIPKDKEFCISRGIDFQYVSNIINFDFPLSVDSYIHRVGRTARGTNKGTALSFVNMKEISLLEVVETSLSNMSADGKSSVFKPYQFRMEEIDGFRYRATDAMRAVTSVAVREARLKEIKDEILKSEKLKAHFEDNPRDFHLLRHDKVLHTVKIQKHLKNVPNYLIPTSLKHVKIPTASTNHHTTPRLAKGAKKFTKRQADPLRSFQAATFSQKKRKRK